MSVANETKERLLAWAVEGVEPNGDVIIRVFNGDMQERIRNLEFKAERIEERIQMLKEDSSERYKAIQAQFGVEKQLADATGWLTDLDKMMLPEVRKQLNTQMTEGSLRGYVRKGNELAQQKNGNRPLDGTSGGTRKSSGRKVSIETTTRTTKVVVQDDGVW